MSDRYPNGFQWESEMTAMRMVPAIARRTARAWPMP